MMLLDQFDRARTPVGRRALLETKKFRKCFRILGPRPISGKIFQKNLTMMLFVQFERARTPVGRRALLETKITKTFRKNCSLTNQII